MATAPAIVRFVGGSVPDALATTRRMYDICVGENPGWAIPILEFRGTPTGIDVTAVLRTGELPQINTGMAGRVAGVGQVGAGLVTPPMECFVGRHRRPRRRGPNRLNAAPARPRSIAAGADRDRSAISAASSRAGRARPRAPSEVWIAITDTVVPSARSSSAHGRFGVSEPDDLGPLEPRALGSR